VYAESPSSGKATTTAPRSAAWRSISIVSPALNAGSATRIRGTATATRAKPWRYGLKKSSVCGSTVVFASAAIMA